MPAKVDHRIAAQDKWDPELSKRTAVAFEKAKHLPEHPKVKEAYDALKQEILAQFDFLRSKGVRFEPWRSPGQPYTNSMEMAQDARTNRHLHYFPTEGGFGQGDPGAAMHPLNEEVPGRPGLKYNDMFRAVHDYFGHAMKGHQFGPKGELQAWGEHARMFSPKARLALTAETHGQNSWVNFGPHSDKPVTERPYAEQKATIMPKNATPTLLARGDVFLKPTKPEDDLPDPDSKPSKTYSPVTSAKVVRRTVAPVWRLAKNGGHLVGLPQKDGTTLVHRFDTLDQARSVVFDWWKGASPEHRKGLVEQMKSLPKPGTPKITLGPKPIPKAGPPLPVQAAKPLPMANRVVTAQPKKAPAWLGKPPVKQPDAYTQSVEYKPGMQPPTKLNRKESSGSIGTAVNELLSNRQRVRRAIAQKIAQEAGMTMLGMSDAASLLPRPRASVVQQIGHNDHDTATYAAAWYGMLAREPRLTVFHEGQGNDFLHVTKSPLSVSQILDAAAKAGLPGVTVSPDGVVHSYNPGGNLSRKIVGFHKMIRASRPETIKGTGHQIGARTGTESQARREYREVIKKFQGA